MPSKTITLYDPVLRLVSGTGDASLTLTDADDGFFEIPDQTGNNQSAELDGSPVTINAVEQALGAQLVVANVGGALINLSLTPVRITVEDGFVDDTFIYFPGLPDGANIVIGVSVPLVFPSDIAVPLCLASDTLIRTGDSLRRIGDIKAGDMVATQDGGLQKVCWVGRQEVDFVGCPEMRNHQPILIKKDAFGEGRPYRDVTLSPQHAVMFDGWEAEYFTGAESVFVIAKSLVNGTTVIQLEGCDRIEYCHILFEEHHVIWAQGLPVESLFLGDLAADTLMAHKREELLAIFPDLDTVQEKFRQRARMRVKSYEVAAMLQGAA